MIFWLTFKLIWNADRLNFYSCVKKFNYKNKIYRNSKNWQLEKIIDLTIFWNWISPSPTALKAPFSQMAIFFLAKNNVNISLKVHQKKMNDSFEKLYKINQLTSVFNTSKSETATFEAKTRQIPPQNFFPENRHNFSSNRHNSRNFIVQFL